MSRRYKVKINEKDVTVEVVKQQGCSLQFVANGEPYHIEVEPLLEETTTHRAPPTNAPTISAVPNSPKRNTTGTAPLGAVVAPMPGIIVSVSVKQGESVKLGQILCVIEAMKMENNIVAPRDGIVSKVNATQGKEVENGAVLFVLE